MSLLRPTPSPFDTTLVEPLWRRTSVVLLMSVGVSLALAVVDYLLGRGGSVLTALRVGSLPLFGAAYLLFRRLRASPAAGVGYAALVAGVDVAIACASLLAGGPVGAEVYGTLYPLVLLPPLLRSTRPLGSFVLQVVITVPAATAAAVGAPDIYAAATRVVLFVALSTFSFVLAHAGYWTRRRAYESAQELVQTHLALEETQRQLVQAEKLSALGTLSACIAHELAQPLTLLAGYASLLSQRLAQGGLRPDEHESVRKQIDTMLHAAKRMTALTDHLRGFARRSGQRRPTALNDAVHGALLFVRGDLRRAGISLALELAPMSPRVVADPIELEQVILNLLTNARDALRDRPGAEVVIATRAAEGEAVLEVRDNGPGVPPALREAIFQFSVTTKPEGQGTGLGLWVSNGIVRNLGGSLRLAEGGSGATFVMTVPVAPPDAAGSDADDDDDREFSEVTQLSAVSEVSDLLGQRGAAARPRGPGAPR